MFGSVGLVDLLEEGKPLPFGLRSSERELLIGEEVRDGAFAVRFYDGALVDRWTEAGGESAAFVVGTATAVGENDEGGEVIGEIAKCVGCPGAEARKAG